jgi:hypothetical protein
VRSIHVVGSNKKNGDSSAYYTNNISSVMGFPHFTKEMDDKNYCKKNKESAVYKKGISSSLLFNFTQFWIRLGEYYLLEHVAKILNMYATRSHSF